MYKVEQGVPQPTKRSSSKIAPNQKYPFPEMAVGDSFNFEVGEYYLVSKAAYHRAQKYNQKFYVSQKYSRCWREK